jgi:hypothetical protein
MRVKTIVESILLLALSVSAQTSNNNEVDSSELLAELTQLPECAVSSHYSTTLMPPINELASQANIVRPRRLA